MDKKEKTAVDALIDHSRAIFRYKTFLHLKRRMLYGLSVLNGTLPSDKNLKNVLEDITLEIRNRIEEREKICARFIEKILSKEKNSVETFYLSSQNLKDGYIVIGDKILFLCDVSKPDIKKGTLMEFNKGVDFMKNCTSCLKQQDLVVQQILLNEKTETS